DPTTPQQRRRSRPSSCRCSRSGSDAPGSTADQEAQRSTTDPTGPNTGPRPDQPTDPGPTSHCHESQSSTPSARSSRSACHASDASSQDLTPLHVALPVTLHRERLRVPGVRAERTERREPTTTASLLDLSDLSRGEVSRTSLLILRHIPPAHRLITRAGLLEAVRVHQVPLRSPEDQRLHDRRSVLRIRPSRRPVV